MDGLPDDRKPDPLTQEAAMWFARMRGDDADKHSVAFERWLSQGALHRSAYNRIGAIFAAGKTLRPELRTQARAIFRWSAVAAAIAALGLACTALLLSTSRRTSLPASIVPQQGDATASIANGTVHSIRLPQGGTAMLDVDARLATDIAGNGAGKGDLLRLERGRIRITVNASRPARTILAGSFAVRSTGGTFDLWLHPDATLDATILTGRVQIRPVVASSPANQTAAVNLTSGQRYRLGPNGAARSLPAASGLEWPQGVLEYRSAMLADIVEEANRYTATKILLAEPKLGERQVSGRFRVDEPQLLAARLAVVLALELDRGQPGSLILRRSKKLSSST